jgi:hypothetical protein
MYTIFSVEILKGRDSLEDLGVNGNNSGSYRNRVGGMDWIHMAQD